MEPDDVDRLVFKYIDEQFKKLGSKNKCKCTLQHTGKWWVASPKHWNFTAASKAVEKVWGVKPDLTREGGRSALLRPLCDIVLMLSSQYSSNSDI
jgi:Cys-Gly metallodipeptidase DUG1